MPPGAAPPEGQPSGAPPAQGPPAPATLKRPTEPVEPPDQREFDVRPDEAGMVQFQFRNQAWPDILKWLAGVSNMSLDWQELPPDFLNIASHRKYSLEETRDVINRHLLARGFTLLEFDNTLLVAKTAGINVSLVPKVDPEALASLPPNRFVRLSIGLESLVASEIVAELKPLISTNGSLSALSTTNRLEAMDSARNLQELVRILNEEQSDQALDGLAREFPLQYVRATEARDQLASFLKLENSNASPSINSNDPNMMQMRMQQQMMQQQMQMQMQQQQGGAQPPKPKTEIFLVANTRRNSLIAHAPPNQMAIIAAFVKRIDVEGNADNLNVLSTRMKVYRLAALDPQKLVASLLSLDALEPTTKLEVDDKNKAIIAYASLSDQLVIQQTIDRLDGSAREFDVIQLRRLKADEVAGTVRALMGIEKEKTDNSRQRFYSYDPWGQSNRREQSNDQLRVGANVQSNQLLIWANDMEREEIHKLLIKLGEIPENAESLGRTRVIDANRSRETLEYLQQLKKLWQQQSDNPLLLPDPSEFEPPEKSPGPDTGDSDDEIPKARGVAPQDISSAKQSPAPEPSSSEPAASHTPTTGTLALGATHDFELPVAWSDPPPSGAESSEDVSSDAESSGSANRRNPPAPASLPPIEIRFDPDGNLVLESADREALDRLERWMTDRAPPARKHVVYYIRHTRPSWIKLNLEDYFKEDKKDKGNDDLIFGYIFGLDSPDREEDSPQLGKQRKLRFISDNDTKSLVVIGADTSQQETIARLIQLWDVASPEDKQSLRYSKVVQVEHSKAESIVEAIKDAFRDLLSSNDKALSPSPDANKETKRDNANDSIASGGGMSFSFSGRLSLGIDRITNSIIVSAKGEDLLKLVCDLIHDLDEAAKPTGTVQSIKLNGANPSAVEKALRNMMRSSNGPGNEGQPAGQPQNPGRGNPGRGNPGAPPQEMPPGGGQAIQNVNGGSR